MDEVHHLGGVGAQFMELGPKSSRVILVSDDTARTCRSLDRIWIVIDDFGLDFEVEKHVLCLLRNAEMF